MKVTFKTLTLTRQIRRMNSERKIKYYQTGFLELKYLFHKALYHTEISIMSEKFPSPTP